MTLVTYDTACGHGTEGATRCVRAGERDPESIAHYSTYIFVFLKLRAVEASNVQFDFVFFPPLEKIKMYPTVS